MCKTRIQVFIGKCHPYLHSSTHKSNYKWLLDWELSLNTSEVSSWDSFTTILDLIFNLPF